MFEIKRKRAEAGRKGAMRAFPASHSQSDADPNLSDKIAMEAEEQYLGAAAPSERGNDKYLEEQKKKREKTKAKTKDREEKRKRSDDKAAQEFSEETEEEIDTPKWKTIEEMSPEYFHKVLKQQDRESRNSNETRTDNRKPMQHSRRSSHLRGQHRRKLKKQQYPTTTSSQGPRETTQKRARGNS